jgi:hypothetical protein
MASGGNLANFNGFWYADLTFPLPGDATDVSLSFSGLTGDDRAVLQLNGTNIGDYTNGGNPGTGVMSFPPGPPDVPFAFVEQASGTVTSGFLLGTNNILRLVVNNTYSTALSAHTRSFGFGDGTAAYLVATVTYSVPEPDPFGLIAFVVCVGLVRRRRGR